MNIPTLDLLKLTKEPTNQLKNLLPYSFIISPGVCLLKNAAVMATYQVEYPDLESSAAGDIAGMAELFNSSVMALAAQEGWAVWFDCKRFKTKEYPAGHFTNLAGWLIDERRNENYRSYGEHFTTEYYVTFVYQLPGEADTKSTALFYKNANSQKNKKKKNESTFLNHENLPVVKKEIEQFEDEIEKVMGTLGTRLWYQRLDDSQLFSYIKSSCSLHNDNLIYPENTFFFLDNYLTDMDVHTSMPLKIGEYYVPVLSVMDFPNKTYPAIFDGLNRTMVEFRWTTRFIPLSKEASMKQAEKYQNRFYSSRKSGMTLFTEMAMNVEIDKENRAAVEMESQASDLQADIALGNLYLGYYTSNLMVWDKNFEKAKDKARRLSQIIRASGFGVKEETLNNFNAWLGMLPGNIYSNVRRPLITTKNLSHIIPLSSAWQGHLWNRQFNDWCNEGVPHCVCSTNYGTPFFLNLNVNDVGHSFVFGPTGSGKSTLLALLMAQATKYPDANIICIDKQLSSRAFMVASGGVYVEPGKDKVAFQPLSELKNPNLCSESEYNESILWCQQFIEGLLSQQGVETNPIMSSAINETLKLLSNKDSSAHDLTSFQGYVNYIDPATGINTIQSALEPYCKGGEFGSIFDADVTTLNLSKIMAIEMGSLMRLSEKAVAPALMYIFRYLEKIWNVGHGEKQPVTFLFLDEAWLYLQSPIFASFVREWLKTLRKKRVFCIFATQEVADVAKSSLRETILTQCITKIYLADPNAATPAVADSYRYFGLTDSEISALSHARMKWDYFFKNTQGCRMFQLDLDDFQLALIASDHELLDNLEDEYGKNTGKPLAFELLEYTKEKYIRIGKDPRTLDYSKFKELIDKHSA